MNTKGELANVSVLVVTYNNKDQVKNLTKKLNTLADSGAQVLVADNASGDNTYEEIIKQHPKFKPVVNKSNLGFSKAINNLIRSSDREYVLLLNPDAFISPVQIKKMIEVQTMTNAGAVVPALVNEDRKYQASVFMLPTAWGAFRKYFLGENNAFGKYRPRTNAPIAVEAGVMAVMLLPRSTIDTVGLLDESFFLYFEDLDYCRRIKKANLKVWYVPSIKVMHEHGASGKNEGSIVSQHLINSSEIYHGSFNNWIINTVLRIGQKWQKIQKKLI